MSGFNLDDYVPVDERLDEFWKRHPEGRVWTDQVMFDIETGNVEFTCHLFTDRESDMPVATGFAHEVVGSSPVNRSSAVENCETSAIGRALANLGIHGKRNGQTAPRPSREEMEKVERTDLLAQAEEAEPIPDLLDDKVGFGKYGKKTWAQVLEEDRSYVEWAVAKAEKVDADMRATLKDALEPAPISDDELTDEALAVTDDLPF